MTGTIALKIRNHDGRYVSTKAIPKHLATEKMKRDAVTFLTALHGFTKFTVEETDKGDEEMKVRRE